MKKHLDPQVLRPSVLNHAFRPNAPLIRCEGRLLSDLTMPMRDWSALDSLACDRLPSRSVCASEFASEAVAA